MSNFPTIPNKNNGDILTGADYNVIVNTLRDYLNGGGIGNAQVSSNPAEKIAGSKVDAGAGIPVDAHHARHEPGGGDMVRDIKFNNGGLENASAHVARHLVGGADPFPAGSLDGVVLKDGTLPQSAVAWRKRQESFIQNAYGVTADPKNPRIYTLANTTASLVGRGVVRNGKLYMAAVGFAPDAILKIDIDAGTETIISLGVGDVVRGLVLIGTDIFILTSGGAANCFIKKLDVNDALTTLIDLNTGGGTLTSTLWLRCNHAGTRLFCIGSGATNFVVGVNTDGTGLTRTNTTSANPFYGLQYAKRGAEEKLWYLEGTANNLVRRNIDGTADATLAVAAASRRLMYDGEHIVVGVGGGGVSHTVIDPWGTMRNILVVANPVTLAGGGQLDDFATTVNLDIDIFDGRAIHFAGGSGGGAQAVVLSIFPAEGYRAICRDIGNTSPVTPGAIAVDNTYVYVAFSTAGANTTIRRFLRD